MTGPAAVAVRPMAQADLVEADRVFRLAFGTHFGLKDPMQFRAGAELIRPRWTASPEFCFVAESGGRIVGSILGTDWGSIFVLGPVSVDPGQANRGIARALMAPVMDRVAARKFPLAALYTHSNSPKHIHLYESYGFNARLLTPIMSKPVAASAAPSGTRLWSSLPPGERSQALAACRAVSGAVHPGLDLSIEIETLAALNQGDVVLVERNGKIAGFALCHVGPGSEAVTGTLFVKFACVRPGESLDFARLVEGCESLAAARGAGRVVAGVNMGRTSAYAAMKSKGYRTDGLGVPMLRPSSDGYNRPEIFALDDWR